MSKKGFTIIELIVVIAIIAVLAAIVLVNVSSYSTKSKDAAAKADLHSMITAGVLWYESAGTTLGTYNGWITAISGAPSYMNIYNALNTAGYTASGYSATCNIANCGATSTAWCACIQLKAPATTSYYCVDSTGNKKLETANACSSECYQTSTPAAVCQ